MSNQWGISLLHGGICWFLKDKHYNSLMVKRPNSHTAKTFCVSSHSIDTKCVCVEGGGDEWPAGNSLYVNVFYYLESLICQLSSPDTIARRIYHNLMFDLNKSFKSLHIVSQVKIFVWYESLKNTNPFYCLFDYCLFDIFRRELLFSFLCMY